MMPGIIGCGAYIPLYRLGKETRGWEAAVEKAIAGFDEDSLTMAVAAVSDCLGGRDRSLVDALFFASTTSPYEEKMAAATVAVACDLRPDIVTSDYANSLRSGSVALRAALDAVRAGSARQVVVVTSDLRVPKPGSEFEGVFGDGAAAFLVGDSGIAAEVEDGYAVSDEILDMWRPAGDRFVQTWEERFILDEGYLNVLAETVRTFWERKSVSAEDFDKVVLYAPEARRHRDMTSKLGLKAEQVQVPMFDRLGNTGTAAAPLMLIAALEDAKPGESILYASYGNGADVMALRATEDIAKVRGRRGLGFHLDSKRIMGDYMRYLQWRGLAELRGGGRRPPPTTPSASAIWRERRDNIGFYGVKCNNCGYRQYPSQRICTVCHTKDSFDPVRFAEVKGELFTYSLDYTTPHPNRPMSIGVVNFEGGGRALLFLTDYEEKDLKVGIPLEMSFREMHYVGGMHNYSWKAALVRG
ncbi:3-oxoacyl-[acyl-carrier-protein] synthase III C-terminal domain-containing protein [Chloroflexota bacterium]